MTQYKQSLDYDLSTSASQMKSLAFSPRRYRVLTLLLLFLLTDQCYLFPSRAPMPCSGVPFALILSALRWWRNALIIVSTQAVQYGGVVPLWLAGRDLPGKKGLVFSSTQKGECFPAATALRVTQNTLKSRKDPNKAFLKLITFKEEKATFIEGYGIVWMVQ